MKWVDNCFEPTFALQAGTASKIGVHLQDEDGKYSIILNGTDENRAKLVPQGLERITCITDETADLLLDKTPMAVEKEGLDTYYNEYYWPEMFPTMLMSAEETEDIANYSTEIQNFINEKYATWMMNGGIDEEWDSYLKQLDDMGLQELIAVYQGALDRYNNVSAE